MTPTDTAVILAAGIGTRLQPLTDDRPKALVSLGDETLLGRQLRLLVTYGVRRVVLATGYREDSLRDALREAPCEIVYCRNAEYATTQNAVSLALCREAVGAHAFFKLDGDVVFDGSVLSRLDASAAALAVAVDGVRPLDAEAMKVLSDAGGRITCFGKGLAVAESAGESIGIERIAAEAVPIVFAALEAAVQSGRTDLYYEDVYSELITAERLDAQAVHVGDLAWTEVDDFLDLTRARELVSRA